MCSSLCGREYGQEPGWDRGPAMSAQDWWLMLRSCPFARVPLGDYLPEISWCLFVWWVPMSSWRCALFHQKGAKGLDIEVWAWNYQHASLLCSHCRLVAILLFEEKSMGWSTNAVCCQSKLLRAQYPAWTSVYHPWGGSKKTGTNLAGNGDECSQGWLEKNWLKPGMMRGFKS